MRLCLLVDGKESGHGEYVSGNLGFALADMLYIVHGVRAYESAGHDMVCTDDRKTMNNLYAESMKPRAHGHVSFCAL